MADTGKPNDSIPPREDAAAAGDDHDDHQDNKHKKNINRPQRHVVVMEHDTSKERTEAIVEWTQVIMDKIQEANKPSTTAGGATAAAAAAAAAEAAANFNFNNYYKDLALELKRKLDTAYRGTWHVIAGKEFGSNVTSDSGSFINFKINNTYFLVLQSGPPEREGNGESNASEEKHMRDMIDADQ